MQPMWLLIIAVVFFLRKTATVQDRINIFMDSFERPFTRERIYKYCFV